MAKDTYSYKGWIVSDSFIKRTIAVFLYYSIGALVVAVITWTIFFILAITLGISLISLAAIN